MSKNVVIVTGGNRGIGLGITESFVEAGFFVVVGARKKTVELEKWKDSVLFVESDVRLESNHHRLVAKAIEWKGDILAYINNAGFSQWKPIDQIEESFFDQMVDTNLKGAFWGCKAASRVLNPGSSIINISSLAGKRGSLNNSMYVATKFGMNGLTQSLAKELGPKGIRVNGLCPVLILTEGLQDALMDTFSPGNGNPEKFISDFTKGNSALGRMPTSKEVGDMCVFLASDKASAITGQNINVDCGVFPQ